jgi:hypothetical protein
MGFFYRKSVNLGPFRVNLSGSGVAIRSVVEDSGPARAPAVGATQLSASPAPALAIEAKAASFS